MLIIKTIHTNPAEDKKQARAAAIDANAKSKKAYNQHYNIFTSNSMQKRVTRVQSALIKLYANNHSTQYTTYRANKNKPFVSLKVANCNVLKTQYASVRKKRQKFLNICAKNNASFNASPNTNSILISVHS